MSKTTSSSSTVALSVERGGPWNAEANAPSNINLNTTEHVRVEYGITTSSK